MRASRELLPKHTAFHTAGDLIAECDNCYWESRGKQSSVTAAARRHVMKLPNHLVVTIRVQRKTTYMTTVTVLR